MWGSRKQKSYHLVDCNRPQSFNVCLGWTSRHFSSVYLKQTKNNQNTPGTAGGPGGRDRTLAVKSLKKPKKSIISHMGDSPEVGQKQKTEKKKENTPGTAGGPGGRDRTLAVKS